MKFACFAFLALFLSATISVYAQEGITIKVSSDMEKFPKDADVVLNVEVTNNSREAVRILDWLTPIEGIRDDILLVSADGGPVEYIGPHYRRREPIEEDYLIIEPGQSIVGKVALLDFYDLSRSGRYEIQYNTRILSERQEGEKYGRIADVVSNSVYLEIEGREPPPVEDEGEGISLEIVDGRNEFFNGCSDRQKGLTTQAREQALNLSDDAFDSLMLTTPAERYIRWFGAVDSNRLSRVKSNYRNIRDTIDYRIFKFYCDCTEKGTYAWVKPKQPYKIHLCPLFWSSPTTGYNSKADTLIHEVSHFNVVAGTDDFYYGINDSLMIAGRNPDIAIRNADNYAYFGAESAYRPYNPCAPSVTMFDGSQRAAVWDGANCRVMGIPAGTSPFIWDNGYYVNRVAGTSCPPPSTYDGLNCRIMPYPSWTNSHFVWNGGLYINAGPGNACPSPSTFDGIHCFVMPIPAGSSPFSYSGALYITPPPTCPVGVFDGQNCYIGKAPASRRAFIWGSNFYYEH